MLGSESDVVYLNNPILQVGKFKGNLPFKVNYSGEFESEIISEEISIDESDIQPADSTIEEICAGIYIQHMEKQTQTNDVITDIIQKSMEEKVLSLYTAFLCIEKSLLCEDCETAISKLKIEGNNIIKIYPNPFSNEVTISINLNEISSEKIIKAGIYSVTGQLVYIPELSTLQTGCENDLQWDGNNSTGESLPSGIYIFVLQTDKNIYQVKLIKV